MTQEAMRDLAPLVERMAQGEGLMAMPRPQRHGEKNKP